MSKDKLVAVVLGNRNSGKSETWNHLFGRTVRTGSQPRRLVIRTKFSIEVFLVSGSAEERGRYVGKIIDVNVNVRIILCSIQYRQDCIGTIDFFHNRGFEFYVHWLNPGFRDNGEYRDHLGIIQHLNRYDARLEKHDAKGDPGERVEKMNSYLYRWSDAQGLLLPC